MSATCKRAGVQATAMIVLCVCAMVTPSRAGATVAKPLKITKLTLQATHTVEVSLGGGKTEYINQSYPFTQAGGHPDALTFQTEFEGEEFIQHNGTITEHFTVPTRDVKDIVVGLPPGLLGDPLAVPRCSLTQALAGGEHCPSDTQLGIYRLRWRGGLEILGPIVNVTPEAGQSAEFVLETKFKVNFLETGHLVRSSAGYGFTVVSNAIPSVGLSSVEQTFWGLPAAESHRPERGLYCNSQSGRGTAGLLFKSCEGGGEPSGVPTVPFLTMGTNCSAGPESTTMRADSWEEPGRVLENQKYEGYAEAQWAMPGLTGCNLLAFNPSIEVQPDTMLADAPVGLGVNVRVPQVERQEAPATPQVRDVVTTLPLGMSISPGIVDGIQACNESGPEGINFTGPESEEVGLNGELQLAPGHCPDASTVGTAEAISPLLREPVKGHVYLAKPHCGGPGQRECTELDALNGNLYQLYLELGGTGEFANTGIQIKVAGKVEANPATGQLTTVFEETPQAPYSELKIHLNGGPRAPIDNPAVCGTATTTTDFTPWSAPGTTPEGVFMPGLGDATPSSYFPVEGCASPPGLKPGFVAGTVTPNAGKFSSFTMNLSRQDREQYVKGVQLHTPPGLLGMLSSVPLCEEPEADAGSCPEASKIGTTRVASGAGSHPFEIEGKVYLTGPHDGAPFGLSIATPAVAGPFNLGVVVVRARIDVNPSDSTLTVTTDETGPYALPQIWYGVPLRLQRITVNIDRANFMFNPTNCGAPGQPGMQQVTARVAGSENAVAAVQSQFAVGGCKSLAFKPKFAVSTSGHTSRSKGASLDAKLSYPVGALANDANIARVKVDLPKQLPSRLTTLQKACTAAQFNADPAGCPAASIVGIAKANTPLLPVGLSGPVYFVSHGGEAFPSLIVVLQGDGVRVDLTGSTFISKAGITSSTFKTVPDVPVNTFELYLPEGRYSALAANGNLCKSASKLKMPTEFLAQNGTVLKQSTKIAVTGCAAKRGKARKARRPKTKHGRTGK
jgi:hypothetical protein